MGYDRVDDAVADAFALERKEDVIDGIELEPVALVEVESDMIELELVVLNETELEELVLDEVVTVVLLANEEVVLYVRANSKLFSIQYCSLRKASPGNEPSVC